MIHWQHLSTFSTPLCDLGKDCEKECLNEDTLMYEKGGATHVEEEMV